MELYGLVSIIDDYVFGDLKSFKTQFSHNLEEEDYADLRSRLQPICKRTLRSREIPEGLLMIFDGPDKKIKYF